MPERYPGYDVLNKRDTVSWNDQTREVIDRRLAIDPNGHRFFTDEEWPTIRAVCDRIVPQTVARPRRVPLAAMLDEKLHGNNGDGYRPAELPPMREAWRRALAALDADTKVTHDRRFLISVRSSRTTFSKRCRRGMSATIAPGTICHPRAFSRTASCTIW
jgi:hypothetical protein